MSKRPSARAKTPTQKAPYMLLPYQRRWAEDDSDVKIIEKSRRIGITWATAAYRCIEAAAGKHDVYYIGYNEDQALEFIRDCTEWCKKLGLAAGKQNQCMVEDEKRDILAYRIQMASGKRVTALSSRPRNLRGKQGAIVIDEAAFHDDLPGLIKAATAMLMWGGKVEIISTHNGVDNHFNKLIEQCKAGESSYSYHRVTLDDALEDGLYQRICLVTGKQWSPANEVAWREELVNQYGPFAAEELFCVPLQIGEGTLFDRTWFPIVDRIPRIRSRVRFWDLAATPKDAGSDPDFTAGCLLGEHKDGVIVLDLIKVRKTPDEVEELLKHTASLDKHRTTIGYEEEPGSSGKLVSNHLKKNVFKTYRFFPERSTGDKVTRARPASAASQRGQVWILDRAWAHEFLDSLQRFPYAKHDDDVDSFTGAFNLLDKGRAIDRFIDTVGNF